MIKFYLWIRTLSTNEFLTLLIANHKISIDVIRTNNTVHLREANSSLVISFDVRISVFVQVLPHLRVTRCAIWEPVWKQLRKTKALTLQDLIYFFVTCIKIIYGQKVSQK